MKRHLENLRAKPDKMKRQIAFLTSAGITAVIALFWIVSISIQSSSAVVSAQASSVQVNSPVSALTANVFDVFSGIKSYFFGPSKSSNPAAGLEVVPGVR
jgi:hypothetical protein